MKKILSMMSLALTLLAFGWAQTASAKTVYFQPNSNWTSDGARFALYVFEGDANAWYDLTAVGESGVYSASFDDTTYPNMIFVRMNGATSENNWDNKWNQSADLTAPTADNQLYRMNDGTWDPQSGDFAVSDFFTYVQDFNTSISTSNHDFSVGKNWGHIVGEAVIDGDTYYMSYSYSSAAGINETGSLVAYSQQGGSYYDGYSPVTDVLVTPLVSGTVVMYAKASYSSPQYVEVYQVSDDGKTLGSLIQTFTLSDLEESDVAGWKLISLYFSSEQRLGLRLSNAYIDNFMATSATILPEKKLTINGVTSVSGSTPVACNQNADGSATVTANVKLQNTGDVDLVAGETENYSLTFVWKQYYGSTQTVYDDVTFDITENIAAGEQKTIEATFNLPTEVVNAIFSNMSSGYFYMKVRENVSESVSSAQLQCQIKEYASKFIFDKEGNSSSSATTTPIDFGKIGEETTLNYEIYNSGLAPLTINSFTLPAPFTSDAPATPFEVAGGEKKVIAITMPYGDPGIFAGNLVINYTNFGKDAADYTLGISGTILDPSKNLIAFNNADNTNGQFPEGSIHSDQVYISYNSSADNYYLQSTNTTTKFITPLLTAAAGESFTYDAWYSSYSYSCAVTVYTSTDRVNWTQVDNQTYSSGIGSSAKTFTVTIPEAGDYYLAFELKSNALIDNIYGLTLAATPEHDWYLTEEADIPSTGTQNADYTASIKVQNISSSADNLTATLYVDGEAVATEEVSLDGNVKTAAEGTGRNDYSNIEDPTTVELTFKPHVTGTLPAYIELKADDTVVKTDEVQVEIAEEKAESDLAMESNGISGSTPLNLNYNNSESVSLYTADVLANNLGLKAGDKISSITFKAYKTADEHQSLLSVYYEWTDDTQMSAPETNAMYNVEGMTPYMENELYTWEKKGSSSELEDFIVLTFDEPLVYEEGKSLRIVMRSLNQLSGNNYKQVYWEKSSIYQNPSVSGTYLNYRHFNDTSGERDSGTNYTTSFTASWNYEYLPAIHLGLVVETPKVFGTVADISGKTQEDPLPLAGAKVTLRSTENDVEYTGISDENGNFCFDVIQSDLVYDEFICELDGYATEYLGEDITFDETCSRYVTDYSFSDDYPSINGCMWSPSMWPCVEVTISESTYATFYYQNEAFQVPEGVVAYVPTISGGSINMTEVGAVINADCPVVLNGAQGTYQFRWADNTSAYTGDNALTGSEEGGKYGNDGAKYYVLCWKNSNKNIDEVGFYYLTGSKGKYAKVKAHQAYIRLDASQANEAGFTFVFDADSTTGMAGVETDAAELDPNMPMYNLAGQRVGKDYRGVVIQNGKKVLRK